MDIFTQSKLYLPLYRGALVKIVRCLHDNSDKSEILLRCFLYYKIPTNTAYF